MKIDNNSVSFQSKIKLIDLHSFKEKIRHLSPKKHEVGWPWTADTMKKGKNLFTTDIMDCIAVGIVDGSHCVLAHLGIYNQAKARAKHQKGFSIENVKRRFLEKIDLNNDNLHGFILGGFQLRDTDKFNVNQLNKIKKFFKENNISYTIFGARKDVHYFGKYSLLYSNKEDTLYVTNNLTDSKSLNGVTKEMDVKSHSIEYNVYKKTRDKYGIKYECIRKETGLKDYFESQFRDVSISEFDELI